MPTHEDYQNNLRAEYKIFGYEPKHLEYPPKEEIKFSGKDLGKIVLTEDGELSIITPVKKD